jgi:hypothetical protein
VRYDTHTHTHTHIYIYIVRRLRAIKNMSRPISITFDAHSFVFVRQLGLHSKFLIFFELEQTIEGYTKSTICHVFRKV